MYKSNQFPVKEKTKPASFTLVYKGVNVCLYSPYPVCVSERKKLVKAGYDIKEFRIQPNF